MSATFISPNTRSLKILALTNTLVSRNSVHSQVSRTSLAKDVVLKTIDSNKVSSSVFSFIINILIITVTLIVLQYISLMPIINRDAMNLPQKTSHLAEHYKTLFQNYLVIHNSNMNVV